MKGKKKVFAILAAVLMVFAMMPMSAEPVYAEDIPECTVILDPGFIGGEPVTVKSTEEGMLASEPRFQDKGMFQWDGASMWYRYPDLPETFTVPDGLVFNGWTAGSDTTGYMPGFSATVDDTLTLTAQWAFAAPEKTYDFVIGFTGSSDGNINGARVYWAPVDGADGYAVQVLEYYSFEQMWWPISKRSDVEADYSAADNNYSVDLLNGNLRCGRYKAQIYAYKYFNGTKIYSKPLESEERAIGVLSVWDLRYGGEIFVTKMSEDQDPGISVLIRDHWADRFLTDEGKYLNSEGDELVAVTPEDISAYDTYEELREAAWFLPGEDRDAGTVPEADYVECYPVWKSDLAQFCADDHDLVFHEGTPETCTDAGMIPYYECDFCGKCFTDEQGQNEVKKADLVIPAKGHRSVTSTTKATLTANGKIVKKCGDCGKVLSTTKISRPSKFKLSAASYVYSGSVKKPKVTVTDAAGKVVPATNYDLKYTNNKNVGKASAVVTLKGNYSGTKTVTFKINPKGTSLKSLTKASKAITVKWAKQATKMSSARITGYQIQLATNSKFTVNKKTVTVKGYSKTSKKVTGLKGGKKFYVRIRTYRTISGIKYYSPWSIVKTVTTGK